MVERLPVDQVHGVEVVAVVLADGVDRDDVGVVQLGRGLGLALEALLGLGAHAQRGREDLQGHAALERDLAGLVDHAHTATADLAQQLEVAEALREVAGPRAACWVAVRPTQTASLVRRPPMHEVDARAQHRQQEQHPADAAHRRDIAIIVIEQSEHVGRALVVAVLGTDQCRIAVERDIVAEKCRDWPRRRPVVWPAPSTLRCPGVNK